MVLPISLDLSTRWGEAVSKLAKLLIDDLKGNLIGIVALSVEEPLVYDSNVLVVLRERRVEDVFKILRLKREVEREYGDEVVISPFITVEGDELIEKFLMHAGIVKAKGSTSWMDVVSKFTSRLLTELGGNLVRVKALSVEEPLVYDSNVLVVLRERRVEDVFKILRLKREVEREYGDEVVISPFITVEGDELIEKFQGVDVELK